MLVLTRKQEQQIQIGENITLTILKVKGQSVRVGVEAPQGVRILRGELVATSDLAEEVPAESTVSAEDDVSPTEIEGKAQSSTAHGSAKRGLRRFGSIRPTASLAPLPR